MNNLIKGAKKKTYTSAGSLIFTGESSNEKAKISTFQLKQGKSSFIETVSLDEIKNSIKEDAQTWINVIGLHDVTTIRKIGEQFEIHPLILEDALNIHHLPKMEEYFKYIFFTMKSVSFHDKKDIKENHVTLLLGDQVIFSFQQYKDPVFDHVRERLTKRTIDSVGADFIFYVIIDFLTDSYYPVLEKIEEDMQKLEDSLIYNTGRDHIGSIIKKRKQLILLRKLLSSLEEEIKKLKKTDHILIDKKIKHYLTDVYDHSKQLNEINKHFLELIINFLEMNRSNQDNRMNKTMKTLAAIATIFMPITLLTGIYGMNFDYIPGLHWKGGFFVFILICAGIIYLMIRILKRNKWI